METPASAKGWSAASLCIKNKHTKYTHQKKMTHEALESINKIKIYPEMKYVIWNITDSRHQQILRRLGLDREKNYNGISFIQRIYNFRLYR